MQTRNLLLLDAVVGGKEHDISTTVSKEADRDDTRNAVDLGLKLLWIGDSQAMDIQDLAAVIGQPAHGPLE